LRALHAGARICALLHPYPGLQGIGDAVCRGRGRRARVSNLPRPASPPYPLAEATVAPAALCALRSVEKHAVRKIPHPDAETDADCGKERRGTWPRQRGKAGLEDFKV
jgi:hypothetical protein